jgi:hypothetical protein
MPAILLIRRMERESSTGARDEYCATQSAVIPSRIDGEGPHKRSSATASQTTCT